jgi:hypothetical protein
LSSEQREELLGALKARFEKNAESDAESSPVKKTLILNKHPFYFPI